MQLCCYSWVLYQQTFLLTDTSHSLKIRTVDLGAAWLGSGVFAQRVQRPGFEPQNKEAEACGAFKVFVGTQSLETLSHSRYTVPSGLRHRHPVFCVCLSVNYILSYGPLSAMLPILLWVFGGEKIVLPFRISPVMFMRF